MNKIVMLKKIKLLLFQNKTLKQTLLKNTFWLTVSNVGGRLIRAVFIILAARILGAAGYGIFSYVLTLAGFFTVFSDIGLSGLMTREAAKEFKPEYSSTMILIKLFLIGVSSLMIIFIAPNFTRIPQAMSLIPWAALLLAVDSLRDFNYSFIRAHEKMELEALVNISTNLAITVFGTIILFLLPTNKSLFLSYTAGSGIGLIVSIIVVRRFFYGFRFVFNKEMAWEMVKDAWPFTLLGILGTVMLNTDTLMIGWFKSASDLGYYSAAQRPIQLLYLPAGILATALFPTFSRLANKDDRKFRSLLERAISFCFLVAIPLFLGGVILAPQILTLLFGSDYLAGTTSFRFLMVTLLWTLPGTIIGNAIFAYNQQKKFIGYLALGALGNVFFNYLLIPPFGIAGAAFATILAQTLAYGFNWKKMREINNFQTFKFLPRIAIASSLMAMLTIILKLLGFNAIFNILISGLFYFLCLYFLKEPLLNFLSLLKTLKAK